MPGIEVSRDAGHPWIEPSVGTAIVRNNDRSAMSFVLCMCLCMSRAIGAEAHDGSCRQLLLASQFRAGLIVRPSSPATLAAVEQILQSAGSSSCRQTLTAQGTCVVRYPAKPAGTDPPTRIRNLLARGSIAGGANVFRSIVLNSPVYLIPPEGRFIPAGPPGLPQEVDLLALGAQQAWSVVPPHSDVTTAVVDSGAQQKHPALATNLLPGQSFLCKTGHCGTPDDTGIHGTNMSGIIAGNDPATGFRGVAWNTRILPLQAFSGEFTTDAWLGAAIEAAVAQHVAVINASWYSPCPLPTVQAALQHAQDVGVLFVVAAGRGGNDIDTNRAYPAYYGLTYTNMLVVMGHDRHYQWSQASNWGKNSVDIAAPALTYTTQPCPPDNCYASMGPAVSFSTAYVTGAIALLKSAHPAWPASWLKTQLLESAVVVPGLVAKSKWGKRLSLDRALLGPLRVAAPASGTHWRVSDPLEVSWSKDYVSSLCTAVAVSLMTDPTHGYPLAQAHADDLEVTVSLRQVPPTQTAVVQLRCSPGDFTAVSGQFSIDPVR